MIAVLSLNLIPAISNGNGYGRSSKNKEISKTCCLSAIKDGMPLVRNESVFYSHSEAVEHETVLQSTPNLNSFDVCSPVSKGHTPFTTPALGSMPTPMFNFRSDAVVSNAALLSQAFTFALWLIQLAYSPVLNQINDNLFQPNTTENVIVAANTDRNVYTETALQSLDMHYILNHPLLSQTTSFLQNMRVCLRISVLFIFSSFIMLLLE